MRLVVSHLEVSFGRYEQAMVFAPGGELVGGFVWQVEAGNALFPWWLISWRFLWAGMAMLLWRL